MKLKQLYAHIPSELRDRVVELTENFERIGPFQLPIELPSGDVVFFTVYHYFMKESKHRYYLITRNETFINPLLRIESVCNYAHLLNSRRCDCRFQLMDALEKIHNDGDGLVIFCLDQHGKALPGGTRGHALVYALGQLQNQELIYEAYVNNGFQEDYRNYNGVVVILNSLGISRLRLLSNNPERVQSIKNAGFTIDVLKHEQAMDPWVCEELYFKKHKLRHLLQCNGFKADYLKKYGLNTVTDSVEE